MSEEAEEYNYEAVSTLSIAEVNYTYCTKAIFSILFEGLYEIREGILLDSKQDFLPHLV